MVCPELRQKVEKTIQDNRLVGEMSFSDADYEKLLECTRNFSPVLIDSSRGKLDVIESEILFVTLVEIAKRWKSIDDEEIDDSGFWEFVLKTLFYTDSNPKQISAYRNLINDLGGKKIILVANMPKKYYATLMMHAFAPVKGVCAFLDLGYNIFRKDLDFNYIESDKVICGIATKRFREILQNQEGNEKSVSIGNNVYGVRIGLRSLALSNECDFIALLDKTLENISMLYHKQTFKPDNYFKAIMHDWWYSKLADVITTGRKIGRESVSAVSKQNITVKFIRDDQQDDGQRVFLVIPPIRLDGDVTSEVWLSVYVGDNHELRVSEELFTKKGEFTVTTKQKEINLNGLFQKGESIRLHVKITENGIVIFDSNNSKKIEREFILFDGENEVLSQINKANDNYFVYTWKNITALWTPLERVHTIPENVYNIYPKVGETLTGEVQKVFFEELADKPKGDVYLRGNLSTCEWRVGNISCAVFSGQVTLLIPNEIEIKGLDLYVGNTSILLSQLPPGRQDGSYKILDVTAYVPKREHCEIRVYSHLKEENLLRYDIVVFPGLCIVTANAVFYGNDEKKITISVDGNEDILCWDNTQHEVLYPLNGGDLIIKIPYIRWRINNKEWHNEPLNKKLWHKEYFNNGSLLEIDSSLDTKVLAYLDAAPAYMERNKDGKFEVGRYIFANEYKKEIMFLLSYPGREKNMELFIVATEEHFESEPITYSNGKLFWHPEDTFIGNEERLFRLEFSRKGKTQFRIGGLKFKDEELKIDGLKDGIYKVNVISQENGLFKNEIEIDRREIIIGRKEAFRFENKRVKIEYGGVRFDVGEEATKVSWKPFKWNYFIDKITFENFGGRDVYLGNLFNIDVDGRKKPIGVIQFDNVTNDTLEIKPKNSLTYDKENMSVIMSCSPSCERYCVLESYKFKVEEDTNV